MKMRLGISLCVLCVFALNSRSAAPTEELLQRVPGDIGFVVVVQDLRGLSERLPRGPFAKKLLQSSPGKVLAAAPEWNQLKLLDEMLQKEMGATSTELRDGLVGESVVFLYRPDAGGNSAKDESAVLVYARDPQLASRVFAHVDAAQTKSGQLKSAANLKHNGHDYKRRERKDEPTEYQYQRGPLLAFGSSETLIRQIIDADHSTSAGPAPLAKRMQEASVDRATIVWWVNPRAFDAALAEKQRSTTGPETAVLAAFAKHWQAIDGLALSCQLGRDAELRLTVSARPEALPESVRLFVTELAKPSALLSAFPEDALAVFSGRFSLSAILQAGNEFLPLTARNELTDVAHKTVGVALGPDVLAALPDNAGPDWGICLTAPVQGATSPLPVLLAAVRLTEKAGGPPVASRVVDGLNTLATFAVIGYNAKKQEALTLRVERIGSLDVRVVSGKFLPQGVRPSYAWKAGYLVFASNPEAIGRFTPPADVVTAATADEAPICKIAFRAWAKYLRSHRQAAAQFLVQQDKITLADANSRLDAALEVLDLFDVLDLSIRTAPGRAMVSLRLRPVAGLIEP